MQKKSEINIKFEYSMPDIVLGDTSKFYAKRVIGKNVTESFEYVSRFDSNLAYANSLAFILAIENNLGIEVNQTTRDLREIGLKLEIIHSHVLHFQRKIIPNILGLKDLNQYVVNHKKEYSICHMLLKKIEEAEVLISKRFPHPINIGVGGFYVALLEDEKTRLNVLLKESLPLLVSILEILLKQRKNMDLSCVYSSLWDLQTTPLTFGMIKQTDSEPVIATDYFDSLENNQKQTFTGPLARINNSNKLINYTAEKYIKKLGLKFPLNNVYSIPLSMCLEAIYFVEKAQETLKTLNLDKISLKQDFKINPGLAVSCVESAKGLIYHEYLFDSNGIIIDSKLLFPLSQNLSVVEQLISSLDLDFDKKTRKEIFEEVSSLIDSLYI